VLGGLARGAAAPALGGLGSCSAMLAAKRRLSGLRLPCVGLAAAAVAAFGEPPQLPPPPAAAAGLQGRPLALSLAARILSPSPFSRYALGSGRGDACLW
jgi:hypothetical protein